jgi:addiction module HigA family antidote
MSRTKKLTPIHPGEILLEEFLKPLDMTMNRLAVELHVPPNRITQIVAGVRGITGETALRLARYFGTSPEFWLNLQARYDLETARDQYEDEIAAQVHPKPAIAQDAP